MRTSSFLACLVAVCGAAFLGACASSTDPAGDGSGGLPRAHDGTLRTAAIDYEVGDLSDPAVMAKYDRVDLLIVQPWRFWDDERWAGDLDLIRAANPGVRIVAYLRPFNVRAEWRDKPHYPYTHALWQACSPHLARTVNGDTASVWEGSYVYDLLDPAVRADVLDVFAAYQGTGGNTFDGVFWDNFCSKLWGADDLDLNDGEIDLDGDGVGHFADPDEIAAMHRAQEAWVRELRARFGEGFIQIANGDRALQDSTFAATVDGMFYEGFPTVGFPGDDSCYAALDPDRFNNLFAASRWPRTRNGGPWVIPTFIRNAGGFVDQTGTYRPTNTGDFLRALCLLTGATSLHTDLSGRPRAGVPAVELDLGLPQGPTEITGNLYRRAFARGTVEVILETGVWPAPFAFTIRGTDGRNIQRIDAPYAYP